MPPSSAFLNEAVDAELAELPVDMRARLARISAGEIELALQRAKELNP
jgi:hypothetical protein